jgi:prepilin-type N-terminal cleavage/methylation domain-containing protein
MDSRPNRQAGFSLMELLICMAVMMVVTVAAFPTISKNLHVYRLQSSAQELATLMQRARILAVRNNTTYSLAFVTANGTHEACIDLNHDLTSSSTACDSGDPMVALASNVSVVTDGSGASTSQITCGSLTTTCPSGFTGLNYFAQGQTAYISYNDRGLPCVGSSATTEPNPSSTPCTATDSNGHAVGFVTELQYAGSSGKSYAAVSITPSGLVNTWTYDGSNWEQQ